MAKKTTTTPKTAPKAVGDWRGATLERMRKLILEADPEIVEERKWKKPSNPLGVPVFSRNGIVCTGETYKAAVKLTFAQGAKLPDPKKLFNASLEGNMRRAIDIAEGATIDATAFKALVKAAVAFNSVPKTKTKTTPAKDKTTASKPKATATKLKSTTSRDGSKVTLLTGGNPQIAKADGDAPVQAFIAAMPDWKHAVGKRLDALIVKCVPGVRKAVRWNTPFYGVDESGFFLGFHCMTKYVKVAFFRGASFEPKPPGESKQKNVRYLDIYENDAFDEPQLTSWIKQAAALPGWKL